MKKEEQVPFDIFKTVMDFDNKENNRKESYIEMKKRYEKFLQSEDFDEVAAFLNYIFNENDSKLQEVSKKRK
jgi:hypothetical protein